MRRIKSFITRGNKNISLEKQYILDCLDQKIQNDKYSKYIFLNKEELNEYIKKKDTVLDIGFGNGENTLNFAKVFQEYNFIGIEMYKNGLASFIKKIDNNIDNIKVIHKDAYDVLTEIDNDSIHGLHLFFPDPWPKKKHYKRRLIKQDFLNLAYLKLKKQGYIYIISDHKDYKLWIKKQFDTFKKFKDNQITLEYFRLKKNRIITKFENKGLEKGHIIEEFFYEK